MRISVLMRHLTLLFALTSPALLLAQFQQPTGEELKMTADPKAPGAAAVYLNVEEVTNDPLHFQTFYARIKVLSEKGKELATVELPPYLRSTSKISEIKGRTIHSDGTVIPLTGKPEDLLVVKGKTNQGEQVQVNRKVFTLPSVEVGSILEYAYTIQYEDNVSSEPRWEIQRPYFVHKAHYLFVPAKQFLPGLQNQTSNYLIDAHNRTLNTLIWWPKLPEGVTVKSDVAGHYTVDVADVPPTPKEENMPPVESIRYKVFFYYKASSNSQEFWINEAKLWSKDVDHFAEPSRSIREAVAGIISPADSDLDKAKKLYKAVQALDNTDYSRKKTESEMKQLHLKVAKRAEDTWAQKSGSSEDIALLYLAMLRAASLTAYATKVVDRDQGVFDITYLSLSQLDDTLVVLSSGGKEIELDPGEKMCPFQTVNWQHSSAGGLTQSAQGVGAVTTGAQQYTDNKTLRIGDITLDAQGALTGSFRIVMTGQEALRWRQKAITNDEAEVKKQFDKSLESIFPDGVEAHIDHFTGLDDPNVNLVAFVNAKGSIGAATSKRFILPAFFLETRGKQPFVAQEKRTQPVDMHYGDVVTDQVTYHLPGDFTVEGAPLDNKISWPQHAILTVKSVSAPGQITIARSLASAFTFAKPEEYQDLRGFYQKVAAADQAQLVLAKTPPAPKGN
ncbi:MAG: DUF3857 domain-containing transglutaminase family protein [Terracidiphilus sp.]